MEDFKQENNMMKAMAFKNSSGKQQVGGRNTNHKWIAKLYI